MNGISGRVLGTMTAYDLRELLQRCHWIAARRGQGPPPTIFGMNFRSFLDSLLEAGALRHDSHISGFAVRDHVVRVVVLADRSMLVEGVVAQVN